MKALKNFFFLFFVIFTTHISFSQGFEIPEKPNKETSVYDYIDLLKENQKINLENKLIRYSDTTSTQIVVAVINSTEGENIAYLGANWLTEWGIGQKGKDNGVLIILAKDDRKINISTGYGVEHLLTDYTSRQIIEYDIIPYFKRGDFYGGLNKGADAIFEVLNGEYKGTRKQTEEGFDAGFIIFIIILIIFFILISRGNRGNRGGGRRYRQDRMTRDIFETIILSNSGRGGGFSGGFGGGMGGGGGATGSW